MKLRPYQELNLQALRESYRTGHKAPLFVGPTGYGKTVLFAHITRNAVDRGRRVMILCHRAELIDQIVTALRAVNIVPCIIAPDQPEFDARVYVASVWTLHNRLSRYPTPDLLVVDEAHHAVQKTTWGKIMSFWPNAHRLGVTATPIRLSGEGLGEMFDDLVIGPTTQELIDGGYLSPVTVYAPSTADITGVKKRGGDYVLAELETAITKSGVVGDAITHYKRLAAGKRAVVFCVSVEHAKAISNAFNQEGIPSESIDGSLDSEERKRRINDFRQGLWCLRRATWCQKVLISQPLRSEYPYALPRQRDSGFSKLDDVFVPQMEKRMQSFLTTPVTPTDTGSRPTSASGRSKAAKRKKARKKVIPSELVSIASLAAPLRHRRVASAESPSPSKPVKSKRATANCPRSLKPRENNASETTPPRWRD